MVSKYVQVLLSHPVAYMLSSANASETKLVNRPKNVSFC